MDRHHPALLLLVEHPVLEGALLAQLDLDAGLAGLLGHLRAGAVPLRATGELLLEAHVRLLFGLDLSGQLDDAVDAYLLVVGLEGDLLDLLLLVLLGRDRIRVG